jgi:hypothetical protein
MCRNLFLHLSKRAGFTVLDSILLNWGEGATFAKDLDCLTLIEKPVKV